MIRRRRTRSRSASSRSGACSAACCDRYAPIVLLTDVRPSQGIVWQLTKRLGAETRFLGSAI